MSLWWLQPGWADARCGNCGAHIQQSGGDHVQTDLTAEQILRMAQEKWEVFHLIIAQGSHARAASKAVRDSWTALLGQRAIWVEDYTKIGEIIVSTLQILAGDDVDKVVSSWSGDTGLIVANAVKDLARVEKGSDAGMATL
jgi:hypothetical protein